MFWIVVAVVLLVVLALMWRHDRRRRSNVDLPDVGLGTGRALGAPYARKLGGPPTFPMNF